MNKQENQTVLRRFVLVALSLALFAANAAAAEPWRVGVARAKITPHDFMWMAGYAHRSKPAETTHAELWAKSVVLEDEHGKRGVLISLDLIGIDRGLSQSICSELNRQYGLQREQVAMCCSHTHTGPVVGKCLEPLHYRQLDDTQRRLVDQYEGFLSKCVVECVGEAISKLELCRLTWGSGFSTLAVNRRINPEADISKLRAVGGLNGPVDHDVPVLAVRNRDGLLRAIVFGYACHATVLDDYGWSGDYPGFAAAELESRFSGSTALFWAGCGGDQNALPRRNLDLAKKYGGELAESVADVLKGVMTPVESSLAVSYQEVPLALGKLPGESELKAAVESEDKYARARALMLMEQMSDGKPLGNTYPYPVGVWKLGQQIDFVFLGGEVVVDFAVRLKKQRNGRQTWVAGYANDVMAYIPSERVLREGGYEGEGAMVYYGLPSAWAVGVEQTIIDTVER